MMSSLEFLGSRVESPGKPTVRGFYGFKGLEVYQLAKTLVQDTKPLLAALPKEESFALCDQLRRASSSIVLKIVKGKGRGSDRDFVRNLCQARGSLHEAVAALGLAESRGYLARSQTQTFFMTLS